MTTYGEHAAGGGLGFAHPVNQRTRFAGLLRHVDTRGCSLLDFGCGHGDLLPYLAEHGALPASYAGVDLLDVNLERAASRLRAYLGCDLAAAGITLAGEPAGVHDVVVALSVLSVDEGPATSTLWRETLDRLWAHTGRTLVFDLLREEPGVEHAGHRRLHPATIATWASELSTSHLIDATLGDHYALVVVHREPTATRATWNARERARG